MKHLLIILLTAFSLQAVAQVEVPKETPQLEFAMQLKVTLGEAYSCGETQHGRRIVCGLRRPCHAAGRDPAHARGGRADGYFKCAPQFEAPADSKYAWLNNALFVCSPDWTQQFKGIVLNIWKIK